jgi:DNA-binding NarL/FixJ family response regulator
MRLAQGRRAEALQLLEYEDHASYVHPRATAHLAGGEPESAICLITERLRELEDEESGRRSVHAVGSAPLLEQAELLELLVQSCLAARRLPDARSHAERLTTLAAATAYPVLVARADRAAGLVHAAAGSAAAGAFLRRSVRTFAELGLVPDAARTRFALATAMAGDDRPGALMLAERALVDLDRLGDATADATARFLRDNGAHTGRRPRPSVGTLTRREQEVLRLLGEGLTNRELAARLFLSRKTVEHHVHNVLTKLGLRTRSEAAAFAVRQLDSSATN